MTVRFSIPGAPVAKGRARISTRGGFARAYTPQKTQRYEDLIRLAAGAAMESRPLMEGPLRATLTAFVPIPSSLSKAKKAAAIEGRLRPTTRPDLDNYVKVIDALNGIVFKDDGQVASIVADKFYSERPRLELVVEGL